ncbi:MAG: hypothetical protein ACOC8A_00055 [bacterium]
MRTARRFLTMAAALAAALAPSAPSRAEERASAPPQETHKGLRYTSTWFGNTYGGGPKWVQTDINGMDVTPDGSVLTACSWDEAHRELSIYDGATGELVAGVASKTGSAVGGDRRYVYTPAAGKQDGRKMAGIARWHKDRFRQKERARRGYSEPWTQPAPFDGGEGREANVAYLEPSVPYHWNPVERRREIERDPAAAEKYRRAPPGIKGIASDGHHLLVASDASHTIYLLDAITMAVRSKFRCRWPGSICLDAKGNLWVHRRPLSLERPARETGWREVGPHALVEYTVEGEPTGRRIEAVGFPRDMACGPDGRLYVADNDEHKQVKIFDISAAQPRRTATFGVDGGIWAGPVPGRMGPRRLGNFSGVGVDAEGNLYVACKAGGSFIRRFDPRGEMHWQTYVGTFMNGSSFDPAYDGTVVYSGKKGTNKFALDYSIAAGDMGTWTAVTHDTLRYPHDRRGYTLRVRRLANGRLYAYTHLHKNGTVLLRKQEDGELFVPSCFIGGRVGYNEAHGYPPRRPLVRKAEGKTQANGVVWRDTDGDGQVDEGEYVHVSEELRYTFYRMDDVGDLWTYDRKGADAGIYRYPLQGFDDHANPVYDMRREAATRYPAPPPFEDGNAHGCPFVTKIVYHAAADTMYLFGYPADHEGEYNIWSSTGSACVRYERWSKPERRMVSRIDIPYPDPVKKVDKLMRAAFVVGDLLVAAPTRPQRGWVTGEDALEHLYAWNTRTGEFLGAMAPGPLLYHENSLTDIPTALGGCLRKSGEYIITAENNWKNLQIVYRIPPQPLLGGAPSR